MRGVAQHYRELREVYRALWGERWHHGLFPCSGDGRERATRALLHRVAGALACTVGECIGDIGCGTGRDARDVAKRYGVDVVGVDLTGECEAADGVKYLVCDWLENPLADDSLDGAYAIESLAHVVDKRRFFAQAARTLRAGARLALACWSPAEDLSKCERWMVRKIAQNGRMAGFAPLSVSLSAAGDCGFRIASTVDISAEVAPTWWRMQWRALWVVLTQPWLWPTLVRRIVREPSFAIVGAITALAYATGAVRYDLVVLTNAR